MKYSILARGAPNSLDKAIHCTVGREEQKKKKQNALRFVCVRKPDILRIFYPIEAGMTECRQHEWQYMSERANINTKRRTHIILTAHAHRSTLTFTSNEHSRHTQIHSQSVGFGRISKNTRFFFSSISKWQRSARISSEAVVTVRA